MDNGYLVMDHKWQTNHASHLSIELYSSTIITLIYINLPIVLESWHFHPLQSFYHSIHSIIPLLHYYHYSLVILILNTQRRQGYYHASPLPALASKAPPATDRGDNEMVKSSFGGPRWKWKWEWEWEWKCKWIQTSSSFTPTGRDEYQAFSFS